MPLLSVDLSLSWRLLCLMPGWSLAPRLSCWGFCHRHAASTRSPVRHALRPCWSNACSSGTGWQKHTAVAILFKVDLSQWRGSFSCSELPGGCPAASSSALLSVMAHAALKAMGITAFARFPVWLVWLTPCLLRASSLLCVRLVWRVARQRAWNGASHLAGRCVLYPAWRHARHCA